MNRYLNNEHKRKNKTMSKMQLIIDGQSKRIAELEETMNNIVEAVLDNRSKTVTAKTLGVIREAIDKFDLRRDYKGGTS